MRRKPDYLFSQFCVPFLGQNGPNSALYGPKTGPLGSCRPRNRPLASVAPCHIHHATPGTGLLPYRAVLCYCAPCPVQTVSPVWTTLDRLVDSGSLVLLVRWIGPTACRVAPCQGSARRGSGSPRQGQSTGTGSGGVTFRSGPLLVYEQSTRSGPGGALYGGPFFTLVLGHFRCACRGRLWRVSFL